jgi:hypothetical protein
MKVHGYAPSQATAGAVAGIGECGTDGAGAVYVHHAYNEATSITNSINIDALARAGGDFPGLV